MRFANPHADQQLAVTVNAICNEHLACHCCADDDEESAEAEFFYNEDEGIAGVNGHDRQAMLDHYDAVLELPATADDLGEVSKRE